MSEDQTSGKSGAGGTGKHEPHLVHVMPLWLLTAVWVALMVLTYLTVAVVRVDLGSLNLWLAMGIATVKAALVALFFMHLWYDRGFQGVVFLGALLFVLLFIGFAMMDSLEYQGTVIPEFSETMLP